MIRGASRTSRRPRRTRHGCALACLLLASPAAGQTILIEQGSATRYLANASDPGFGDAWKEPDFLEGPEWSDGTFGLGVEGMPPGAEALIQTPLPAQTRSVYTRTTIDIPDATGVYSLFLGLDYDDGYVAWVNGVEVYRSPEMRTAATTWDAVPLPRESSNGSTPDYSPLRDISSKALPALIDGPNVLAIGTWSAGTDDLVLLPQFVVNRTLTRAPYLQMQTPTTQVIRWNTALPTVSRVIYGPSPDTLDQSLQIVPARREHEAELELLEPNTRYYYAVGTDTEILAGGDAEHYFETPPPVGVPKPLRIWVLGDSGRGNVAATSVRDAYYAYAGAEDTDLWLMLGDNAYPNGTVQEYQQNLFDIFPEMLRRSTLWPTIGNHDIPDGETWPYVELFSLPEQAEVGGAASGSEQYYSFDHANIHFVVLDSMFSDRDATGEMGLWLEADLLTTNQEWVIAYWHHPPYSKGSHDSDTELPLVEMREEILPILDAHGVDLVLSGHSHSYERSVLISGHYGTSGTFTSDVEVDGGDGSELGDGAYQAEGPGIVYGVAGNGSQLSIGIAEELGGTGDAHPAMHVSMLELGSLVLEVDGQRLDAKFLDETGEVADEFTMIKGAAPVAPIAALQALPRIVDAPGVVAFVDESANRPTSWSWDLDGDGSIDSVLPNPSATFEVPGRYSVGLVVTNHAGTDSMTRSNYVCVTGGAPDEIAGLGVTDDSTIVWTPNAKATEYDLLRGDLTALRSTGSLQDSQTDCLHANGPALGDPATPQPGHGIYYLARGTNCVPEAGTFDAIGPGQSGSRDVSLQGTPGACGCPEGDDGDSDGYCGLVDNCPEVGTPDLTDQDGDGQGDVCDPCPIDELDDADADGWCADEDNCPEATNAVQEDTDQDNRGDVCDPCPYDALNDADADGWCADGDNCPEIANPAQEDFDLDDRGDVCDPCTDGDGDGFGNPGFTDNTCALDGCPQDPAKSEPGICGCGNADLLIDGDLDGTPDCVDGCPDDPLKIDPGICGCGYIDEDSDEDGAVDCVDSCPNDPFKTHPGFCGCGEPDDDSDGDGTADCIDGCPADPNKIVPGVCGCGEPELLGDTDDDGTPDCADDCPGDPFKIDPGICGCGLPDLPDDGDGDGVPDCADGCPDDPDKTEPGICGCGVDEDDPDDDGVPDCVDECPSDPFKAVAGLCGCGVLECWTPVESGTTNLLEDVQFPLDAVTGYAVGQGGAILRTTDSGATWSPRTSGTLADLEDVTFPVDTTTGYAVGEDFTLLKTIDGGASWVNLASPSAITLRDVHFVDAATGFVVGDAGTMLRTTNGGVDWTWLSTGTSEILESVQFPEDTQTGYVAGRGGTILKTTDGGDSWTPLDSGTGATLETLIFPSNPDVGYVVGDNDTILKTVDGGQGWTPLNVGATDDLRSVDFPNDAQAGFVVGDFGEILRTDDGGMSWSQMPSPTGQTLRGVSFPVDDGRGYAVGSGGTILVYTYEDF